MDKVHLTLIAGLIISGGLWLHEHDKAIKANILAVAKEQELITMREIVKQHDSADAVRDSIFKELTLQLAKTNEKLKEKEKVQIAIIDTATKNFLATLNEQQAIQFNDIVGHYNSLLDNRLDQIKNYQELLANANDVIKSKNNLLDDYRKSNDSLFKQVHMLTKGTKKSLGSKVNSIAQLALLTYVAIKQ